MKALLGIFVGISYGIRWFFSLRLFNLPIKSEGTGIDIQPRVENGRANVFLMARHSSG